MSALPSPHSVLVRTREEDAHEVQEDRDHHEVRGNPMHGTNPRSERNDELDVLDGLVRALDGRHIKKEERQAGQDEEQEQEHDDRAAGDTDDQQVTALEVCRLLVLRLALRVVVRVGSLGRRGLGLLDLCSSRSIRRIRDSGGSESERRSDS